MNKLFHYFLCPSSRFTRIILIEKKIDFKKYSTNLLQGIPGSGKTHIYFEIIKKALEENYQVLVLLPEKGLSEQIAKRFKAFNI